MYAPVKNAGEVSTPTHVCYLQYQRLAYSKHTHRYSERNTHSTQKHTIIGSRLCMTTILNFQAFKKEFSLLADSIAINSHYQPTYVSCTEVQRTGEFGLFYHASLSGNQ